MTISSPGASSSVLKRPRGAVDVAGMGGSIERRVHDRGTVQGTCLAFDGQAWRGPFDLADLSVGGARLVGECVLAPETWVRVLLRLPGRPDINAAAKVVWQAPTPEGGFAIAFAELAPEDEETVLEAVSAAGR